MEITGTKQKILDASLRLFSKYGYDAVSVEQIAEAVGIKAPSLYKHYRGKQDIYDSIFALMDERYRAQLEGMRMHIDDGQKDLEEFRGITEEALSQKVAELVRFSLRDEYNREFRRLLTAQQFASLEAGRLYTERYVDMLIDYHAELFKKLIGAGVFIEGDPEIMALQYVSPVYTMIGVCDREPEREDECMRIIARHIHAFNEVYRRDRRKTV